MKSFNKLGKQPSNSNKYYAALNVEKKTKFSLQPINRNIILKMIEDIDPSKSVGIDNIEGRFLRDGAPVLVGPIADLCHLSIMLCKFPQGCKIAKLKPLYKKGSKLEPKNYRPISVLPLVSKIFETIFHSQTFE